MGQVIERAKEALELKETLKKFINCVTIKKCLLGGNLTEKKLSEKKGSFAGRIEEIMFYVPEIDFCQVS